MKTLFSLLTLAVPAAFILSPVSLEVATSALFVIGFAAIALYDYTSRLHPWVAAPAASGAVKRHRQRLGLAG
jgi:hypothetical protein